MFCIVDKFLRIIFLTSRHRVSQQKLPKGGERSQKKSTILIFFKNVGLTCDSNNMSTKAVFGRIM